MIAFRLERKLNLCQCRTASQILECKSLFYIVIGSRRVSRCYFDCNVRNISAQIHRETLDYGKEEYLLGAKIKYHERYVNKRAH